MINSRVRQLLFSDRGKCVARALLFVYVGLVLCPIQYWALAGAYDVDNTWLFGLNYAAAHGLVMGRDIIWPAGPLAYLAAPMDIGNNLALGLGFQMGLWAVLLAILWDLFFCGHFPLPNLVFFSVLFGLSGPLYHQPPNPLGAGDLLLVGALILLVHFQLRAGMGRYIMALLMLGLVPLIKLVGMMLGAAAVVGLIVDRIANDRRSARNQLLLAAVLPAVVTGTGLWLTLGSFHAIVLYLKGSLELSRGYNLAMSLHGPTIELLAAFEALVLLAVALGILAGGNRRMAAFFTLLLTVPVLLNVKHAFVRQPLHAAYAFGFVVLAVGLVVLPTRLEKSSSVIALSIVTLLLAVLCQDYVVAEIPKTAIRAVTGAEVPSLVLSALRFGRLRQELDANTKKNFSTDEERIEPEIKAIVQHEPVASLSESYSGAFADGLNLALYPVLQRYSAYTPYLDRLNANWIRDKGPRFLIFDGKSVLGNGRHPWTETPAMWLQVYRWYDTRMLGRHNLLLQRRREPRFREFEELARRQLRFGEELWIPASSRPVFWTMQCSLTASGKLRAILFRVLDVTMTVDEVGRRQGVFRVVPELLDSPSLGDHLPSDLSEYAEVFGSSENYSFFVGKLSFGGPGSSAYAPVCEVRLQSVR